MSYHSEKLPQPAEVAAFDNRKTLPSGDAAELRRTANPGALAGMWSWVRRMGLIFWLTVAVPSVVSIVYFGFIASDVYVSESRFVVRSPERPQKSGLGVLLSSAGFANASEEVQAAQGYIQSRDALRELDKDGLATRAWGNQQVSIFNRFNPLGYSGSFEEFFLYYNDKVDVEFDTDTGITTMTVRAFSPTDARSMNTLLLAQAEALVNQLNERGEGDQVLYAEKEVAEAQEQARRAALALAAYRNRAGVLDPEKQGAVQLQMVSKLQDELIGAQMQLVQLTTVASQNSQIPLLKMRITGLQQAISEQLGKVAGDSGSLSAAAAQYQRLQLQREFADRQLGLALAALQDARSDARRQRAYVERVAQPSLPDDAMEPRRLRGILATIVIGLVAWGILSMLLAGVREHSA